MSVQLDLMPEAVPAYDIDLAQYFTPPKLARKLAHTFVDWGTNVLEPTAGSGALVAAALEVKGVQIDAYDIDPRWVEHMERRFAGEDLGIRLGIHHGDFLKYEVEENCIDTVLMNPPDNSDKGIYAVDFLEHAMYVARCNGGDESAWVVALIRSACLSGLARAGRVWMKSEISHVIHLARRPHFAEKGGKQDWCVVRYREKSYSRVVPDIGWWTEAWN